MLWSRSAKSVLAWSSCQCCCYCGGSSEFARRHNQHFGNSFIIFWGFRSGLRQQIMTWCFCVAVRLKLWWLNILWQSAAANSVSSFWPLLHIVAAGTTNIAGPEGSTYMITNLCFCAVSYAADRPHRNDFSCPRRPMQFTAIKMMMVDKTNCDL